MNECMYHSNCKTLKFQWNISVTEEYPLGIIYKFNDAKALKSL